SVSLAEFEWLEGNQRLAMAWRAHGLAYGVTRKIDDRLQAGCVVLINGSRGYLSEACKRYGDLLPVLLTVDSGLLRQRLVGRGRETHDQIAARLARNARFAAMRRPFQANPIFTVDNSGSLEHAVGALHTHLTQAGTRWKNSCD